MLPPSGQTSVTVDKEIPVLGCPLDVQAPTMYHNIPELCRVLRTQLRTLLHVIPQPPDLILRIFVLSIVLLLYLTC